MQKRSKRFDDIFKNMLKGMSPESNPADWIMMERLLEMEGLTQENELTDDSRLDEVVLDKLSNLSTGAFIPNWDKMSNMIDDINEEPSIDASEFDQAIDNKIKTTESPLDLAAWGRIETILAQDRAALIDKMDEVAKGKLSADSDIAPSWNTMNAKINRELFLPESIVKYKIIEVALVILFVLSATQYSIKEIANIATSTRIETRSQNSEDEIVVNQNSIASDQVVIQPHSDPAPAQTSISDATLLEQISENISAQALSKPNKTSIYLEQHIDSESLTQTITTPADLNDDRVILPAFRFTYEAYNYIFQPQNIEGYEASLAFLSFYDLEILTNMYGTHAQENQSVNPIGVLDYVEAPILAQSIMENRLISQVPPEDYASNSGLTLSVFTGSDYNEIVSPVNNTNVQEGTQKWNMGYTGGLALGVRFKNWELETGAIYASNQYSPQTNGSATSRSINAPLRDIELEIVKIPLNFRFNVNLWDKWKVYALSGATMNMVMQSEFTAQPSYGKGAFASPPNSAAPSSLSSNATLTSKDFGEGILEGGSFTDNSFFTANLGIGVERSLNRRWSLFAQPTYQHQIFSNPVSTNQDRYNAISLFFGAKMSLSKKVKKK